VDPGLERARSVRGNLGRGTQPTEASSALSLSLPTRDRQAGLAAVAVRPMASAYLRIEGGIPPPLHSRP